MTEAEFRAAQAAIEPAMRALASEELYALLRAHGLGLYLVVFEDRGAPVSDFLLASTVSVEAPDAEYATRLGMRALFCVLERYAQAGGRLDESYKVEIHPAARRQ